jgi:hypothetical protein
MGVVFYLFGAYASFDLKCTFDIFKNVIKIWAYIFP